MVFHLQVSIALHPLQPNLTEEIYLPSLPHALSNLLLSDHMLSWLFF